MRSLRPPWYGCTSDHRRHPIGRCLNYKKSVLTALPLRCALVTGSTACGFVTYSNIVLWYVLAHLQHLPYISLRINCFCTKNRPHNPPRTQGTSNTKFTSCSGTSCFKMWVFIALLSVVLCSRVLSNKAKPCLKKMSTRGRFHCCEPVKDTSYRN